MSKSKSLYNTNTQIVKKTVEWNGKQLTLETGRIARQSSSVYVTYGNTSILCTVAFSRDSSHEIDFLPLTVIYQEKSFAIGKIPGAFMKRELKPSDNEVLVSRIIDRSIRPLLSDFLRNEVQVICEVKDFDGECDTATLSVIGCMAALMLSGLPVSECIAAVRVGKKNDEFVFNDYSSDLNLVVAAGKKNVFMIECESDELIYSDILDAIKVGFDNLQQLILAIEDFAQDVLSINENTSENSISVFKSKVFKYKNNMLNHELQSTCNDQIDITNDEFFIQVKNIAFNKIYSNIIKKLNGKNFFDLTQYERKNILNYAKHELNLHQITDEIITSIRQNDCDDECEYEIEHRHNAIKNSINSAFLSVCIKIFERMQAHEFVFLHNKRLDGRELNQIRHISCETGIFNNSHGSSLFTRGMTQAMTSVVIGLQEESQLIDDILGERRERFILHYNFPPFAVGEVGKMSGPGRREIGHGNLARKSFSSVLPQQASFPYTIRAVTDITESDGSSSMATVCSVTAALLSAGVSLKNPVAGIAMGLLIKDDGEYRILTDIAGAEDALGDMDFKVAGTRNGITALQLDIKCSGLSFEILNAALQSGYEGYCSILDILENINYSPFNESKIITRLSINREKIRDIVGVGGRVVKDICQQTGAKLSINDAQGEVVISGSMKARKDAEKMVKMILNR